MHVSTRMLAHTHTHTHACQCPIVVLWGVAESARGAGQNGQEVQVPTETFNCFCCCFCASVFAAKKCERQKAVGKNKKPHNVKNQVAVNLEGGGEV